MQSLIKNQEELFNGYIRKMLQFEKLKKEFRSQRIPFSINEGNSFIRFSIDNFNSLFFIYEIGNVFPNIIWRHLLGRDESFNYNLLTKAASFLPAYSFSLDQPTTLIYWGDEAPFLSAETLKSLRLSNLILKAEKPHSVEVSVANLVWPKSAYKIPDKELEQLASLYLFNSLMPPILDRQNEVWSESPFILIGDRKISFTTIHKTICTIDKDTARMDINGREINIKATILDRYFNAKRIPVDMPDEAYREIIQKEPPYQVVFVKKINVKFNPTGNPEIRLRYKAYPFESLKLFSGENYGWLLTATSIILRECYLKSPEPLSFTLSPEEFRVKLRKIYSLLFLNYRNKELGLDLTENKEGINTLASILGVYAPHDQTILYLHPALIECFISMAKNPIDKNSLIQFQRNVYIYSYMLQKSSIQKIFKIQELFKTKLKEAENLEVMLNKLLNVVIPLSKTLKSLPENNYLYCEGGEKYEYGMG